MNQFDWHNKHEIPENRIFANNNRTMLLVCIFLLSGCKVHPVTVEKISKDQITKIASQEMIKHGYDLSKFDVIYDVNNESTCHYLETVVKHDPMLREIYIELLNRDCQAYQAVFFVPTPFPERIGISCNVIVDIETGEIIKFFVGQ